MTSIIRLTPVSGALDQGPPCYLLQIDDFRFLLDSGWDEKFNAQFGTPLQKLAEKVDVVLISHSDNGHLGALPYLVGKCGLKCPVYATTPVMKMGQMFLYDTYLNHHNTRDFSLFNLDDIDCAIDMMVPVTYGHAIPLKGKGHGITITALQAGHTLGGAVWKISKSGESDIYYAIDHNNKKERHLNGFEVGGHSKIGTLITNSLNSLSVQEKRRKRDEQLLSVLNQTLRTGGNVLIATDTAGRSLELTLMLDQMWRQKDTGLTPYSLVFLNNVAFNVLEFAKEQVEWMGEKLQKSYETTRVNPYQLRNVVLAHTLVELAQVRGPKVVIASAPDLESGFSRDLFLQWCGDHRSSVVVTGITGEGTLGRKLIEGYGVPGKQLSLEVRGKVRVDGGGGDFEDKDFRNNNGGRKRKGDGGGGGRNNGVKYVCVTQNFVVNCGVHFIEFEGRSDVEASVRMVQEMEPERLVVVRGSGQETEMFKTLCQSLLPGCNISCPGVGQVVELTSGRELLQVSLSEQLTSRLEFSKLRGMELAWVDCQVGGVEKKTGDPLAVDVPKLYPLTSSTPQTGSGRAQVFVNRLRLSEFKQILGKHGIHAEYNDKKVLTVKCRQGGAVYIQRHSESKQVIMEGDGLSDEYYKIRQLLYEQFAIL